MRERDKPRTPSRLVRAKEDETQGVYCPEGDRWDWGTLLLLIVPPLQDWGDR
jgi:hypothetical protein